MKPGKLADIFKDLEDRQDVQDRLREHLYGGTAATTLARDLTDSGWPISATTIKEFRAEARAQKEVGK